MPAEGDRVTASAPLAPVALALAAGIALDRAMAPVELEVWAVGTLGLAAAAAWARPRDRGPIGSLLRPWVVLLLLAFTGLGGAWHHRWWSRLKPNDLAWWIDETPRPAWLRGVLVSVPEFHPPEFPDENGSTRALLELTGRNDGRDWQPCTGRVMLTIGGDRADLRMGHPMTAAGSLAAIAGPHNPGQFDTRAAMRAEGVRLRLSVGEPAGIQPDPTGRVWPLTAGLGRMRTGSRDRLVAGLDPRVAPLASALLLGRREGVDPDINDAFARTGTAHLLAISGLHLQALALAVFGGAMLVRMSPKASLVLVLTVTLGYALLVGLMPSVVRSAAMTAGFCLAGLVDRRAFGANLLALAAVITLLQNPSNLFDTGCQLSFLAVAAIFWGLPMAEALLRRLVPRVRWNLATFALEITRPDDPLDDLEAQYAPGWKRGLGRLGRVVWGSLLLSAVVGVTTAPLVALRFHLISGVGLVLNAVLVPLSTLALLATGLALAVPGAGGPIADRLLGMTLGLVQRASAWRWGYAFTPGPAAWWVAGFYVLVACLAARRVRRWAAWGLGLWTLLPAAMAAITAGPVTPEVEILDVGHGLAVLIRMPGGRTALYDCGRMRDPHIGRRMIARALWQRGVRRLDQVILSHADADHINALPDLAERFAIGELVVSPVFGRDDGELAARLARGAAYGCRVRRVVAGDRLALGGGLDAVVLHPPTGWSPRAPDNDGSLVLDLSWHEHHLLLTGDLDGQGIPELLKRRSPGFPVVVAPHHGGRTANPPALYDWARPGRVVVSSRPLEPGASDPLAFLSEWGIKVLRTGDAGAVRVRWSDAGLALDAPRPSGPEATGRVLGASLVPFGPHGVVIGLLGIVGGLVAVGTIAVVEWGAWALVRPGGSWNEAATEPPPWEPIEALAADGVRLAGAWRRGENGRLALILHGFGESRAALLSRGEALAVRGWSVALLDARGRGRSGGQWTTFGAAEADDVKAWLDTLARKLGPEVRPVVWGRSMGAAIALRAAALDPRITALVLEAPYAELRDSVAIGLRAKHLPGWLAGPLIRRAGRLAGHSLDEPPPVRLAGGVNGPVLVVHGAEDRIAPAAEVRRLASAFPRPPQLIEVPGARHVDVFDTGGPKLAGRIASFLDAATTGQTGTV